MSEMRKYGVGQLFIFPLIADGAQDFVTDYTPAAGDAKVWTDTLISTNLTSLILGFDSLSELPAQGAQIDENGAGTAEGVVEFTVIVSGTVGGGDAAGFFIMRSVTGQAFSNDDQLDINGGTANFATADSTTYDLAATAGLIADVGNGLFAAALSPTEMTCTQGELHIVDSATKAIEDQAIRFTTYGNAAALHAMDLDEADGTQFTEAGGDGDHLTAIDLPNQTMDITGDITGNLSGSVGSVTGAVGSVTGAVGSVTGAVGSVAAGGISAASFAAAAIDAAALATDAVNEIRDAILSDSTAFAGANIDASIAANATPAEVLTQVNAALDTAIAELAQAQPTATPTLRTGLMLLYMALRDRFDTQTSGTDALELYNDAGTLIAKKLITDDGSDYSEAKMVTGP